MNKREHSFQCKFTKWLESEGFICIAIVNGANVSMIERMNLIREGMRPGASDLIAINKLGEVFFLELKTETGKQRKEQELFQTLVEARGLKYFLIRPEMDFKKLLEILNNEPSNGRNKK